MFKIGKMNKIFLTKGDSCQIEVRVFDLEGNEVEIKDTDEIVLTVRKTENDSAISLAKPAILNTIYIDPDDTKLLSSGTYVYDIQLKSGNEIQTIIPVSYFQLGEEITR